jgi:hypothetical protein
MKNRNKLTEDEQFCLDSFLINGDSVTAYRLAHKTKANDISLKVMSQRWITSDSVKKYLQTRKALTSPADDAPPKDYTNKNVLLQELSRLVVSTHNVREKNDVLKSIAAIMQMNKEQSDDEKELIHFYLPITCKRCSLYVKELEDKKSGQTK